MARTSGRYITLYPEVNRLTIYLDADGKEFIGAVAGGALFMSRLYFTNRKK